MDHSLQPQIYRYSSDEMKAVRSTSSVVKQRSADTATLQRIKRKEKFSKQVNPDEVTTLGFFGDNTRSKLKIADYFFEDQLFFLNQVRAGSFKRSGFSTPPLLPWEINLHKCLMALLLLWCSPH